MKKIGTWALLLSLGVFTFGAVGCGGGATEDPGVGTEVETETEMTEDTTGEMTGGETVDETAVEEDTTEPEG
jgi:hypothetical protein